MTILRDISTIYSTCSHREAPDNDYVRRKVESRLSICQAPRDAHDWIVRCDDPYLRGFGYPYAQCSYYNA